MTLNDQSVRGGEGRRASVGLNWPPRFAAGFCVGALSLAVSAAHALAPTPTNGDWVEANNTIFLGNEVTVCQITMAPDDFQFLLENPQSDEKKPCSMRWKNSVIDETIDQVGMRSRGNLSRNSPRRSWKLDFNDLVPDRQFHTLEEMDLNGDYNDPTLLRRRMAHEFLRRMGLPVARTHYVALYVNGDFMNVAIHVEATDEEFADNWFGNKDGNLYKCLYKGEKADLAYRPAEDYQTLGGGETYRETNNDPASDYTDLADFIDFVNNAPNATVYQDLDDHVNVDGVLRYLAANVAIGSWDDYWYGANNYYLYQNQDHGLFELIPYDYDNSVGCDFFGINWATRNFDGWGDGGYGSTNGNVPPLVAEIFNQSEWRRQYRRYLREAATIVGDAQYQALAQQWHNLIQPYFDGTIESGGLVGTLTSSNQHVPYFQNFNTPANYDNDLNSHRHGIVPFLQQRAASLNTQLNGQSTPALPKVRINEALATNVSVNTDNFGEYNDWVELWNDETTTVDISGWHLSDAPSSPTLYQFPVGTTIPAKGCLLVWADNQPDQQDASNLHAPFGLSAGGETLTLWHNEATGKVLVDSLTFPALVPNTSFGRFPDASGTTMVFETVTPCAANDDTPGGGGEPDPPPPLFINEYMASNQTVIQDNFGSYADWIEIYNAGDEAVDMTGLHLTDDLLTPTEWTFPAGFSIPAKGFLLVWADDDEEQTAPGHPHTNFGLGAGGDTIALYDTEANANQLIHSVTFGAQTPDVAEGLLPDGAGDPVVMDAPTPGSTNVPETVDESTYWLLR